MCYDKQFVTKSEIIIHFEVILLHDGRYVQVGAQYTFTCYIN